MLEKYLMFWIGITVVIAIIPAFFIFPADLHSDTKFSEALNSDTHFWVTLITLFVCIPAILEILLDLFSALFVKADVFITLVTRVWVITAVVVTGAIIVRSRSLEGNLVPFIAAMHIRGIVVVTAVLHLLHTHCKVIYTRRAVITIACIFSIGSLARVYSLPSWVSGGSPAYMIGSFLYICGSFMVFSMIGFHLVQECRGRVNQKKGVGYEIIFMMSIVSAVAVGTSNESDNFNEKVMISLLWTTAVTTFQLILLYVAVTHEFKWVRNTLHVLVSQSVLDIE